jgi:hypothetical protein
VLSRHMFFYDSMTRKGMEGELVSNPNSKLNNFNVKSPINLEGSCPHTCVRHASVFKTEVSDYQMGPGKAVPRAVRQVLRRRAPSAKGAQIRFSAVTI